MTRSINKKTIFLLLIAMGMLCPSLYGSQTVDRIIAIVGDDIILQSDLNEVLKIKGIGDKQNSQKKNEILEELIDKSLLHQEIEKKDYKVNNEDLANTIHAVLRRNQMTLEALKAELQKKGIPFEQYKMQLVNEIKQSMFFGQIIFPRIKVTEADINNFRMKMKKENKNIDNIDDEMLHRMVADSRLSEELKIYLKEVRGRTYIDIKNDDSL
ncbi:MAG: hypothetical protein A3I75_04135 [Deltaproteobacteria bacterium RIFCSPLOWO2_02_FULL_50_16]|nr:MAG: hypothetical protein A3B79_01105 [Deltaproteobacteria bacterium RIFCSPHIGHO2_02_FULL_50_15]OGQ58240.1 MAG: hypothetical protein A3I75_04135 [Deltaproteobacteria bacterium RIFCSPLOWO2_02_FULL_50_16]OGQ66741.1 MAG: hypothetical protein A3F89_01130 [Deltaproteobacteria bacterium RIFCSPLOWO2_12_FULL_50_11]